MISAPSLSSSHKFKLPSQMRLYCSIGCPKPRVFHFLAVVSVLLKPNVCWSVPGRHQCVWKCFQLSLACVGVFPAITSMRGSVPSCHYSVRGSIPSCHQRVQEWSQLSLVCGSVPICHDCGCSQLSLVCVGVFQTVTGVWECSQLSLVCGSVLTSHHSCVGEYFQLCVGVVLAVTSGCV